MNKNEAMTIINAIHKGTFTNIGWTTDLPLTAAAKKAGHVAYKKTLATVRFGINRTNKASIKAKMEQGYVPQQRTWGTYLAGSDRFIEHTNKAGEHNIYVVAHSTPNKSKVKYFLDGKEIKKTDLQATGFIQASYFNKLDEKPDVLTIKLENLAFVGKQNR